MLKQYKYAMKSSLPLRLTVLIAVVLINGLMLILGGIGNMKYVLAVASVTVSGLLLSAWVIVCVIADITIIKEILAVKKGYALNLIPIHPKKILFGRLAAMITWDVLGFIIAVAGLMLQINRFENGVTYDRLSAVVSYTIDSISIGQFIPELLDGLLHYGIFLLIVLLIAALRKSFFYSVKGGTALAVICGCIVLYLTQLVNFILIPIANYERIGFLFEIYINPNDYLVLLVYFLLMLIKLAALFGAVSYLMERKINI